MAVRFDASGEHYTSSGAVGTGSFTYLFWGRLNADRNDFSTFLGLDNGTDTQTITVQTGSNGTTLGVWVEPSAAGGLTLGGLTVGSWYRIAVVRDGDLVTGYRGLLGGTLNSDAEDLTGTFTGTNLRLGTSVLSEWLNGDMQGLKVYSAALTVAELEAEWASTVPVRTDSLVHWHPLLAPDTADYSGNGNSLTGGSGTSAAAGPPVPWTLSQLSPPRTRAAATGTAAASLGVLTATASGVVAHPGTATAALGGLSTTVTGIGWVPDYGAYPGAYPSQFTFPGTGGELATAHLGGLTATVSGTRATTGAVTAALGGLTAASDGIRDTSGEVTAALGFLAVQVRGGTTVDITTLSRAVVTQRTRHELWCVARIVSTSGPPTLLDVDPIEWSGLSWTDELSRPQTLQASVAISSLPESIRERLRDMANQPSELHLYRNGRRVFAGQWVGALVQGETLTMQAIGLLGYLRYREIGINQTFSQVDQAQIVKTLIDQAQADARGHWGLDTSGIVDTGQVRDATYRVLDGNNLAQRIEEMGRRDFGFDIEVDPATRQVLLWHPRKGVDRSEGEGSIVFDARNVTDPTVTFSVAPGDVATRGVAVGTSDKDPVLGVALNLELAARFGLADYAERFDGVSEQLTIDDHAAAMLDARDQALVIPGPDVRIDADTDLDLWTVGDTVTYEVNDALGIRGAWRVRKRTVKVDSSGQETVTPEFV